MDKRDSTQIKRRFLVLDNEKAEYCAVEPRNIFDCTVLQWGMIDVGWIYISYILHIHICTYYMQFHRDDVLIIYTVPKAHYMFTLMCDDFCPTLTLMTAKAT